MVLVQRKLTRSVAITRKKFESPSAKKRSLSKNQVKAVKTIAKAVTQKAAETKSFYSSHTSSDVYGGYVYAKNLIYAMSQGYNSETYIGEKIFLKNLHIKGHMAFTSATASVRAKTFRFLIIRHQKLLTSGSGSITVADVFRSGTSNTAAYPSCLHTDIHKADILYDSGCKVINEAYDSNEPVYPFDLNIPVNTNRFFDADNSGVFKGGNYYFLWMAEDLSGALVPAAKIVFDFSVNFKDE